MATLEGKTAIITGAARGIGRAIAERFLKEGARIVICDVLEERLAETALTLSSSGEVAPVTGDVTLPSTCDRIVEAAQERFGQLDIVVNNAGIARWEPFLEHSEKAWDETLAVNLKAVFFLSQRAARAMIAEGNGGVILSTASNNGHVPEKEVAAYNDSKAGVISLTKTMAIELAPYKIRVNCVSPGHIGPTDLAREGGADEVFFNALTESIPLGRLGRLDEVASLFAFLASDEAPFLTGQSIIIDGGQLSGQ